jgi:hypothetical protein
MRYTTKEYFDLNWTRFSRKNGGLIERQNHQSLLDANERDSDVNLGNFWLQIF